MIGQMEPAVKQMLAKSKLTVADLKVLHKFIGEFQKLGKK